MWGIWITRPGGSDWASTEPDAHGFRWPLTWPTQAAAEKQARSWQAFSFGRRVTYEARSFF
jgi:hypothetical protein